jgi:hypothetical protein
MSVTECTEECCGEAYRAAQNVPAGEAVSTININLHFMTALLVDLLTFPSLLLQNKNKRASIQKCKPVFT